MSVVGFDIGNDNCVIAAAKRGGVDVLLNDESKRETPAVVSFGEKQRFFGSSGAAFAGSNLKSTVSQIKRLIGKLYKEVEQELKLLPLVTCEGPRGGVLIEFEYLKRKWRFTPVEILGMLFKHLKQITEENLESDVGDCVIGIPSYFTDLQRRMYLDAACIAGLKPLRLMHDGTAVALGYGMYKTDLCSSGATNVMFVDVGHCDTQVTVASFEEGGMKILSHSFDQNLGGRDFDEVLFKHFAAHFNEKYKIDVYSNVRASVRLRASCEKVKKVLSVNAEAPLSVECLIRDTDVSGLITREEFEKLSSSLLDRLIVPCRMALKDSGLSVDELYTVELVGSGSRIPAITRVLTSVLGKEPTRTLNASECVARGCALRCAMLSRNIRVRDYKIEDSFPYSIVIPTPQGVTMLFQKGSSFPNQQTLDHDRNIPFYFQVAYRNESDFPAGISHIVGHFGIGSPELSDAETVNVKFSVRLSYHGIIEIDSATALEDQRAYSYVLRLGAGSRMVSLPVTKNFDVSTTDDELHEAKKIEKMLTEQDIKVEETKDQRNTLESFVYDTRSKLSGAYQKFASNSEKEVLTKNLQKTEDWLYEDSDDEYEHDYSGKLNELKKLLEPIENRYNEENAIAKATKTLQTCIAKYQSRAESLPAGKKEKVKNECTKAEQRLTKAHSQKHSPSKTLLTEINRITELVESICESIIKSKPSFSRREEPVDSENARVKAAKPLKTCIATYYSGAESLPADKQEKVHNECRETEQWLKETLSQKNLSLKTLSTEVNRAMETFERYCQSIIKSEFSSPRPEKPVDSDLRHQNVEQDQKDQPVESEDARTKATKPLQDCVAKYRSHAKSLPADQREKVNDVCARAERWINDLFQKPSPPHTLITYIDNAIDNVRRQCESIIQGNPSSSGHEETVDSDQRDHPMDMDQGDNFVGSNPRDQPMEIDSGD